MGELAPDLMPVKLPSPACMDMLQYSLIGADIL